MDTLQAKHAFDQIEYYLGEIKKDMTEYVSDWDQTPDQMADRISELEDEVEEAREEVREKESEISSLEDQMDEAANQIESFSDALEEDHPGYSTDALNSIIKLLRK